MSKQFRNIQLDGLRGYAALAVALGHCNTLTTGFDVWAKNAINLPTMSLPEIIGSLGHVLFPADAAVFIFFVLSGYVLWGSLARRETNSFSAFFPYILNRSYRLFPVSIATALILSAFVYPLASAYEVVTNSFFINIGMNGVLWSLQVEFGESIILFFCYILVNRYFRNNLSIFILLFISLIMAVINGHSFCFYTLPFLLGASLYCLPAHFFQTKLCRQTAYFSLAFVLFLTGRNRISRILCCIAAFVFVGNVLHQQLKIFSSKFAQFLGDISYCLYLSHPIAVRLLEKLPILEELKNSNQFLAFLFLVITSLAIAFPLSYLIHIFVEKPGMTAGAEVVQIVNKWLLDRKTKKEAFSSIAEV